MKIFLFVFLFFSAPDVYAEKRNSIMPNTNLYNNQFHLQNTSIDKNTTAMYDNYYYDPNAPTTKSTACNIL